MKRIEKKEIEEMHNMLTHLYFITNKTNYVKFSIKDFLSDYKVKNKTIITPYLSERGILSKSGKALHTSWKWISTEKPSKMMSRRVIEGTSLRNKEYLKRKASEKKADAIVTSDIKNSDEKIDILEFERRLEIVNKQTGEYKVELDKLRSDIKKSELIRERDYLTKDIIKKPSENKNTTYVKLFWGLFSYSRK